MRAQDAMYDAKKVETRLTIKVDRLAMALAELEGRFDA